MPRRRLLLLLLAFAITVGLPPPRSSLARPGGGQGYSGGGGRGSSGSSSSGSASSGSSSSAHSSGGGRLSIAPGDPMPWIAVLVITVLVVGNTIWQEQKKKKVSLLEATGPEARWTSRPQQGGPQWRAPHNAIALVRKDDPEFSAVLFDDFVYRLYAAAHLARHDPEALARLGPYLAPAVLEELSSRPPAGAPVASVVVGAMRVVGSRGSVANGVRVHEVKVVVESNVTVTLAGGATEAEYLKEEWVLARGADVRTRAWTGARTFGCPACGAPATSTADGRCASCGQVAANGRFDWQVSAVSVIEREPRPPALTGDVEERGTDLPTVRSPTLEADWAELMAADASVTAGSLDARLALIFGALHAGWSRQDLTGVRPYVSDSLLQYLQYWVDAYRRQGLRNAVNGARITRSETVRVVRDLHYDAVTLRVHATGFEVTTVAATGKVVGGSRERERPYSEYWTLVRGSGVRGTPVAEKACPSCGAALAVSMGGTCEYCGVHVTSGEFDWVLSRIEQDDSYAG